MSELKPCPFCGSRDIGVGMNITNCYKCGIEIGPFESPDEAISMWNNRTHENKLKADAVREAISSVSYKGDAQHDVLRQLEGYADKLERGEL